MKDFKSFLVSFISAVGSLSYLSMTATNFFPFPEKSSTFKGPNISPALTFPASSKHVFISCLISSASLSGTGSTQVTREPFSATLSYRLDQLLCLLLTNVSKILKLWNSKKFGHAQHLHESPVISILCKNKPGPSIFEILSRTKLRSRGEIKFLLLKRSLSPSQSLRPKRTWKHQDVTQMSGPYFRARLWMIQAILCLLNEGDL